MNRRRSGVLLLVAALLLALAPGAYAQTTGRIFGQLVDAQGAAVPGATVTVSGPALQGMLTQVTDGEGNFRFPSLPPGRYTVKAELAGFKTLEQKDIDVGLDRTVTVTWKMEVAGVAETVTVQGASPVVDTTSTVSGIVAGADQFNRLPVRRDIYSTARLAPGAITDTVGQGFYGSTGAENQYIIDGLNTTGIERGQQRKELNFDFVQEIEVKTGGLPAEYGRMTGGIINVITKSGGNSFRGSAYGFGEGGGLQSDDSTRALRPQTATTVSNISHRRDGGGDLGGFFVKDKLWFFGAYNRVDEGRDTVIIRALAVPGSPAINSTVPQTTKRDLYATKLTWKIGGNHNFIGSVNGDPSTTEGNVFTIAGPESTWKGVRETGSPAVVGRYEGVFGNTLLIQAQVARHKEKDIITGPGSQTPLLLDQTVSPNLRSGGFGGFDQKTFSRDNYRANVTKFAGAHEIKGGIDYEHTKAVDKRYSGGGGQIIYKLIQTSTGVIYYRHRYFVNDRAPGFDRSNSSTWNIALPLVSEPDTRGTSFFAQDSWKVTSQLTVNGGIRWEGQDVRDRDNVSAFTLKQNWAPRIGFIYDFAGNGKSKLYANWGRFFENIPMDINIRAFGGELACFCYNFDPSPSAIVGVAGTPGRNSLLGSSVEPVDPDLRGQYSDELLVGAEYQLPNNFVLGAKLTRRDLGRVIEDFFIPETGEYFIANPSTGIGTQMGFYDFVHVAPAPKAERRSTAFEISANKRFSDNWQLIASAVFSRLEGNYDGLFQASTGQLDPNINSAFDYADFLVNADGKLSNDRNVQIKVDGSYEFSKGAAQGLNLGFSTHWYAGTPLNAYGYSFGYANWEYYLVPRGSVGRGPSDWEADLHVAYPVKVGGQRRLNLIADIFNIFDRQAISTSDERYNLVQDGHCGGVPDAICNGDGGIATIEDSLTPAGSISNPRATATNPDYLKAGSLFTGQRSIRLGARFTF